jgi:hypothetical protein
MIERVTRFTKWAAEEDRREFGRELLRKLDAIGVGPGEEFLIASARNPDAIEDPAENRVGPSTPGSDTSRRAALDNYPRSGSQRHRVLVAIGRAGHHGRTRDELATELGLPDSGTDARVWELLQGKFVKELDSVTRKTRAGSQASVLVLTDKGLQHIRANDPGVV